MTIRPIEFADVPHALALIAKTLSEFGLEFGTGSATDEQLHRLPESYQRHGGAFWVAEIDNVMVGTAGVFPLSADTFELRKMYLVKAARGTGVGFALLQASVAFSKERNAKRLVLDTTNQMTAAIAFYEKHGFVRDDTYLSGSRCHRGYRLAL